MKSTRQAEDPIRNAQHKDDISRRQREARMQDANRAGRLEVTVAEVRRVRRA